MDLFKNSSSEELYLRLGSTWFIDSIYLFIIPVFSFIGFLLNFSCYFAFISYIDVDNSRLHKYLTIYSFNSSILCLIHVFTFLTFSPRYFQHSFWYFTKFYRCKVLAYFSICLCFFGNILDIVIAFDRLSSFLSARINKLNSAKPLKECFLIFIVSLIINIPILFSLKIMGNDELFNPNAVHFCGQTDFAQSKTGMIVNMILIIFRDILTLIVETFLTCLSTYCYKKYPFSSPSIKYYIITTKSLSFHLKENKKPRIRRRLLLMSIYLSFLSILLHLIICAVLLMVSVFPRHMLRTAIYILGLIILILIKNSFNVLIFFKFNIEFKKRLKLVNFLAK